MIANIVNRPGMLLAGLVLVMTGMVAHADEYDNLRARWQVRLTGGTLINTNDPDIDSQITILTNNAQVAWNTMDKSANRAALWPDLNVWTKSGTISSSYGRLHTMALAYATTGSSLKGNSALAADIVAGMDWLYAGKYNPQVTFYDNWWDWQIGTPNTLVGLMTLMYGNLGAARIANFNGAIDHFVPNPTQRLRADGTVLTSETGANLLDKALAVTLRGIVGKSAAKITQGRNAVSGALSYVTQGDGFYVDGSFIQHGNIAYTGGYGPVLLGDLTRLIYVLDGSSWDFTDPNIANVYTWANEAFLPFVAEGALLDSVRGRGIARQYATGHASGRAMVASLANVAQTAPPASATSLKAALKGIMQRDTYFGDNYFEKTPTAVAGVYGGLGIYDLVLLKSILADSAIAASAPPVETHVFASMDRIVQREPGFATSLSIFSNRIAAFEYGNGENKQGWWTGMGMRTIHDADHAQYDGDYWPTVDAYRLPGTTTDRTAGVLASFKSYPNTRNWAGGAELGGRYAAVGLDVATSGVTGSSLTGKKSWFFFGKRIVEIGSGIASTGGLKVETIIENRKLNAAGSNTLTVNGVAKSSASGWSEAMSGVSWAHLAGSVPGSDIAYYWPNAPVVYGLREQRSSSWNAINSAESTTPVSNHFLSLATSQGIDPSSGAYSQVILPGYSVAQAAAFAANPTVTILERSVSASAAADSALGLVGANFWTDASKTVNVDGAAYLSSNRKAAVLTQRSGNLLTVSVADPTQANTGTIQIEIHQEGGVLVAASSAVTVTQLSPTIKLSINVNGAAGKSFTASFRMAQSMTLPVAADAYVRDGASAALNYGAESTTTVKLEGEGYNRQAYLKFDLAALRGTIKSAQLRLAPAYVGQSTGLSSAVYLVPGDSWSETGITWNNRPAPSTLLGSWTVPPVNTYAALDITSQVQAAFAGDKVLSLSVQAPANFGSNGWVQYASKEFGNAALRPVLKVSFYE